jgi:uncharacterized protein (DUF433 family)
MPLYTVAEAARFLGVPASTFTTWARGYRRRPPGRPEVVGAPVLTSVSAGRREPIVPWIGLAEGMVVAAFRKAGVSMQHLRSAVVVLEKEFGLPHALASRRLYTDGANVLYDYAEHEGDEELAHLTVVASQQRVFAEVVKDYLQRITYGEDGWAALLTSPATPTAIVSADPLHAFGQPRFLRGGARVEDVIDRWRAGERLRDLQEEFQVPAEDIEDYLRAVLPDAA